MTTNGISLVVLAAGRGTRFGGVKQLTPAGPSDEPLMDYTVYDALKAGFNRVVFVTSEAVRDALERHASGRYGNCELDFVVQQPRDRDRIWGTGHAVLSASEAVRGPFAVCNADDYYGRSSFSLLRKHLAGPGEEGVPVHALVGYRLDGTLASSGGVSRAVCEIEDDEVRGVTEVRNVRAETGGISGELLDGTTVSLAADLRVSMNLWGFRPRVFPELLQQFESHRDTDSGEFYLSNAVGEQLGAGRCRLRCLPGPSEWFGMTYASDMSAVRSRLATLVQEGHYPYDLAGRFPGPA